MPRIFPIVAACFLVVLVSGCASSTNPCSQVSCRDTCHHEMRMYDGACENGRCRYLTELCEHGCSNGTCSPEPPHLNFSSNPQTRGNFTMEILQARMTPGDKDTYDLLVNIANNGSAEVFGIRSVSIVAGTGLMYSTEGFSWSDMLGDGESRSITFTISEVSRSVRLQNTTVTVRTDHGYWYFDAGFDEGEVV